MKNDYDFTLGEKAIMGGTGCFTVLIGLFALLIPVAWFSLIVAVLYAIAHFGLHWF